MGFGYVGFKNTLNVFSQTKKIPFSDLKESLNQKSHVHHQCDFTHKSLSRSAKEHLKETIRKEEKVRNRKIYIVFILSAILVLFIIYQYILMVFRAQN
ncbi:hypothetical protein GCM10022260_21300 [Gaetbulibacter aestuarii]